MRLKLKLNIINKRIPRRRSFLHNILEKTCFVTSFRFVISFIVLLQSKRTTLAENGENLLSAHLE